MTGDEGTVNPLLEAALAYARLVKVFPVHSTDEAGRCSCGDANCASPGKHPRTAHGHLDATDDLERIRRWWKRWPSANIAMACGASGQVVVDVDERNGRPGLDTWFELRQKLGVELEQTALVETPSGGQHAHYLTDGQNIGCGNDRLGIGIDVKGEGGYVLLPPWRSLVSSMPGSTVTASNRPRQSPRRWSTSCRLPLKGLPAGKPVRCWRSHPNGTAKRDTVSPRLCDASARSHATGDPSRPKQDRRAL